MTNAQNIDVKLTQDQAGFFDLSVSGDDFASVGGLDTALTVSLFSDGRAPAYNVQDAFRRRGWIGNLGRRRLPTSLMWLLDQSRITQAILNAAKLYVEEALRWMVTNQVAKSLTVAVAPEYRHIKITVDLVSYNDQTNQFFALWRRTGV